MSYICDSCLRRDEKSQPCCLPEGQDACNSENWQKLGCPKPFRCSAPGVDIRQLCCSGQVAVVNGKYVCQRSVAPSSCCIPPGQDPCATQSWDQVGCPKPFHCSTPGVDINQMCCSGQAQLVDGRYVCQSGGGGGGGKYAGLCSFDFDGTVDGDPKISRAAAQVCRDNNFKVVGITAGDNGYRYRDQIGIQSDEDWVKSHHKGRALAKFAADHHVADKCVIHFDDDRFRTAKDYSQYKVPSTGGPPGSNANSVRDAGFRVMQNSGAGKATPQMVQWAIDQCGNQGPRQYNKFPGDQHHQYFY